MQEKLYGFVKDNCADYLSKHLEEKEVKAVLESLKKEVWRFFCSTKYL